jgi:hypothetical protein
MSEKVSTTPAGSGRGQYEKPSLRKGPMLSRVTAVTLLSR